jgi:hypothetical protein
VPNRRRDDGQPPGKLIDCAGLMADYGLRRATAERVMRACARKVVLGRRVFVWREEADRVIADAEVSDP